MFFRTSDPLASRLVDLGLTRQAAVRLVDGGTLVQVPAGTRLCAMGEVGRQAFLLVEGEATVHTADEVIVLGPGEVIGEIAALGRARFRSADVVAASAVSVLVFDLGTFCSLASAEDLHAVLAPVRAAA